MLANFFLSAVATALAALEPLRCCQPPGQWLRPLLELDPGLEQQPLQPLQLLQRLKPLLVRVVATGQSDFFWLQELVGDLGQHRPA
jgi:hypothetical protein